MPRATKAADPAKQPGEPLPTKVKGAGAAKGRAAENPGPVKGSVKKAADKTAAGKATATKATATKATATKATATKATATKSAPPKASPKPAAGKDAPKKADKASSAPAGMKGKTDKFLVEQKALLLEERAAYEEQAAALKAQAEQMALEMEPGDIQFDDESGEGGTANIDRERDLALSAQARLAVDEIDHALAKIANGTYGGCEGCGQPILRDRLQALPQARLCVACKSGGLSRR